MRRREVPTGYNSTPKTPTPLRTASKHSKREKERESHACRCPLDSIPDSNSPEDSKRGNRHHMHEGAAQPLKFSPLALRSRRAAGSGPPMPGSWPADPSPCGRPPCTQFSRQGRSRAPVCVCMCAGQRRREVQGAAARQAAGVRGRGSRRSAVDASLWLHAVYAWGGRRGGPAQATARCGAGKRGNNRVAKT